MAQPVLPPNTVKFQREQLTDLIREVNAFKFFGPIQTADGTLTPSQKGEAVNIVGVAPLKPTVNIPTRTLTLSVLDNDGRFVADRVQINSEFLLRAGGNNPTAGAVWTSTGTTGAGEWRSSSSNSFAGLTDTPAEGTPNPFSNYTSNMIFVNPSGTALEFTGLVRVDPVNQQVDITKAVITDLDVTNITVSGGSGLSFAGLNDTPPTISAGRVPSGNVAGDALVFSNYFGINPSQQAPSQSQTPHDRIDIGFDPLTKPYGSSLNNYNRNGINFNFAGSDSESFATIGLNVTCTYSKPDGFSGSLVGQRVYVLPRSSGPNAPNATSAENRHTVGLETLVGSAIYAPSVNATAQTSGSLEGYKNDVYMWRNAPQALVRGIRNNVRVDNGYSSSQSGSDAKCSVVMGLENQIEVDLAEVNNDVIAFHSKSILGTSSSANIARSRINSEWVGAMFSVDTRHFNGGTGFTAMTIEGLELHTGKVTTTASTPKTHIKSTGRAMSTFSGPIHITNTSWGNSSYDDSVKTPSTAAPITLLNGTTGLTASNRPMIDFQSALGSVGLTTPVGKIRIKVGSTEYALMVYPTN